MSIPILFKPIYYNNNVWIDGGCLNNFPIELFDDCLDNVIGIYLGSHNNNVINFENIKDYISQLIKCLFSNVFKINMKKYEKYMIYFNIEKSNWVLDKNEKVLFNASFQFLKPKAFVLYRKF